VTAGDALVVFDMSLIEQQYRRGNALRMDGDVAAAEAVLRAVLRNAPRHRDAAYSLAHMLREYGRLRAAGDVIVLSLDHRRADSDEVVVALAFLCECGYYDQAWRIANDAHVRWPNDARISGELGKVSLALGRFEEATTALRKALDGDPDQGASWLRLAHCRRFTSTDDLDVQRFERGWKNVRIASAAHVCAGFAFGKALDDLADFERAATVLREANMLARGASTWSREHWEAFVDARIRGPRMPVLHADSNFRPIFIIGLPRTGTTLVSAILGRSNDMRDRGELGWVAAMFAHLQRLGMLLDVHALESAAQLIRAQMRRDDLPARYYIDKNPLNFRHLDFIAALFPNARIIHCRRTQRDTALSQWMQHFAGDDLGFTYDFASIADEERGYKRLMTHWRHSQNIQILDVDYDSLVTSPQRELQRLAAFLECAIPSGSNNCPPKVSTASVWQVRQPINTNSVGRWRRYATLLPELADLSDT